MTVNAITDTKKGITGIAPTYLHTTRGIFKSTDDKQFCLQTCAKYAFCQSRSSRVKAKMFVFLSV